ncbi:M24 family metallopeptidase [Cupriavidus taiwanensis]|uniref:M24 family metallopeptidase n=1 Tax=Cupriavidus taiwanensis TaxID=164546 RepID=UPI0039C2FE10
MTANKDLAFSVEEYRRRLDEVRSLMKERTLDCVILDEPELMGWLAGYSVSENLWRACVVPAEGPPFLLVRSLDYPPARQRSWFDDFVVFSDTDEPLETFASAVESRGIPFQRVGVDFQSNSFTIHRYKWLQRRFADTRFLDLERSVWDLRRIKSAEEIALFRDACSRLDEALGLTIDSIHAGGSQREVAASAAAAYYRLGFDDGFVGPITVASDWDSIHGFLNDKPLEDGDIIHIELLPRLRGYSARIMRSAVVGSATRAQQKTVSTLIALQDQQIAAMRPGVAAREVDRIVRDGVVAAGLRPDYTNITGYTLGLTPLVSQHTSDLYRCFTAEADWTLEAGMVLHMYTSARGFAVSETVLVTAEGGERLTLAPRQLFEIQ